MATVTILKDGKPVTVNETTPGLFGRLGYEYADTPTGLSTLPQGGGGTTAPALPEGGSKPSGLLSFATGLEEAVSLAKAHRNKASFDIMKPYRGTVAASDFNSILGNMNQASDSFSSNLTKKATELDTPEIITSTSDNGDVHGIDKRTGQVVWTAKGVGNQQGTPSEETVDSEVKYALQNGTFPGGTPLGNPAGTDGYVDPRVYLQLYDTYVLAHGAGSGAKFTKLYPPKNYINPANTWVGNELKTRGVTWSSSSDREI